MKHHPLIKYPDFRNLFLARLITAVGDKFFAIALSWWIVSQSFENGGVILGVVMGSSFLGITIFGPFTGALSDRFSKKRCMLVAMILSGIIILIMSFMIPILYMFPLVICVFYIAVASLEPMFTASANGAIGYLVAQEDIPQTVAVSEGIMSFSAALGAAFAGVFITLVGMNGVFIINALSFFAAACFIFRIKTIIPVENNPKEESYFQQFKEGFEYIKKEKAIFQLLILFGIANFFLAPLAVAVVLMVKDIYNGTAMNVSILEIAMTLGAITISLSLGSLKVKYNKYKAIFFSFILAGISLVVLSISDTLMVAYIMFYCIGISIGFINISAISIFQQHIAPNMKGRFFSILMTICFAVIPLGNLLMGVFNELYDIKRIIFVQGICLISLSIVLLLIRKVEPEKSILDNQDNTKGK